MSRINTFSYKKRVIITLVLILVYNFLLSMIPLPGVDKSIFWRNMPRTTLEFLFSFPFSIKALGILPLFFAYNIMSIVYYFFLLRSKKKPDFLGKDKNRFLVPLIFTTLALSIFLGWGYARFVCEQLPGAFPFCLSLKFLITMILACSVFLGFLIVMTIDRIGVVDGMFVIMVFPPSSFLGVWRDLSSFHNSLIRTVEGNQRLERITLLMVIVLGIILLIRRFWSRGILSSTIPLKKGGEIKIPIYLGGLFFLKTGIFLLYYLFYLFMRLTIIMRLSPWPGWLFPVEEIVAALAGYWLYIALGKWVINWGAFKDKISHEMTPDSIFKVSYRRFGRIYLAISLALSLFRIVQKPGPLSGSLTALFSHWEMALLLLIFLREGWKEKQILTKDYAQVMKTNSAQDLVAGQIALAEENINYISHQRLYNYLAGCVIGPLSEKTLYVSSEDKTRADEILIKMKNAKFIPTEAG